ncbi:MAG: carbamoyltransferase [Candidatus Omnitrophica bacterium]|nr:carbamoyltransferase [Candidatus Omnitrophota bacterium]
MTHILGISCFYHDSAACLIQDGEIVAAAQEERFTRKKHDFEFPKNAIDFCLKKGGISNLDLDYVAFYEKPFLKFERILETYLAYAPYGFGSFIRAIPLWIKHRLWIPDIIHRELDFDGKIIFPEHHESHAASAFFPSPFERSAILTADGVGEWATLSFGRGSGNHFELESEIRFPHSLGLLYSAFTYYTGFRVNSAEYKVMGLAPYGEPQYVDLILKELMDLKEDGSFKLNMKYFNYCAGLTMTNSKFHKLFGAPPRKAETEICERDMNLARSIQIVTEEVMLRIARHIHQVTGEENLCLSGGVALNCVANGRILREGPFKRIWIQPAAGDAGGALGAALVAWHHYLGQPRKISSDDAQSGSFLGPDFSDSEIEEILNREGAAYRKYSSQQLAEKVAELIEEGNVIGWVQGRMEFGPRALGARSIIGDARNQDMQSRMNLKIKFRESFRPFAPSVLEEEAPNWFEIKEPSPYMLLVADVSKKYRFESVHDTLSGLEKLKVPRSKVPAVTHVDYSARLQTIDPRRNPVYYDLVKRFFAKTGCPVIINTSFNVRGEPIVCTPHDAFRCFMRTEMDYLVIGNFVLDKREQKIVPLSKEKTYFELD